ncbi:hypothetical protein BJY01DRAFT_231115 [Aspergillus pseudoustus]|uniref:Succinate--CoA ligase [ADP-forming] subunit beta, mitochondrial n=1 Tax=Aspergillus pseudoustus TaxID=1810923 RepID=A0ABR4KXP7_9EURO
MAIHEYQGQGLLNEAGIPVPRGQVAETPEAARGAAVSLGGGPCVVKAQVLAGGRGKGVFDSGLKGGVHLVPNAEEVQKISSQMLGNRLRTKQTSQQGLQVDKVYVAEKIAYDRELYLSIAVDRDNRCPVIIASGHGGMNIEAAAATDANSVVRLPVPNYSQPLSEETSDKVAASLGLDKTHQQKQALRGLLTKLYDLYRSSDATLVEINPLVLTPDGQLLCLDSKFKFDSAARFRQQEIFAFGDGPSSPSSSKDALEAEAERPGFAYVRLEGNIGNIVNGAGLAMATNDAVNYLGGSCANFLDAGGRATKETMADAFRIVLSDERVKVVFVNIYGGIIHGDMVAQAIIEGVQEVGPLRVPLVVRLQGTSAAAGQKMLAECGLKIHSVNDFTEAVELAVRLAGESGPSSASGARSKRSG